MKIRIYLFLVFSLFGSGCIAQSEYMNYSKIYYVPIGVETYIPVTTSNIEELAVKIGRLEDKYVRQFVRLLEEAKAGSFDSEYVRAKLIVPKVGIIYLDNKGGAMYSQDQKTLDLESLAEIKELFESNLVEN